MGSATPSIESLYFAEHGNINLHNVRNRYGMSRPSSVDIIQVKLGRGKELISPILKMAVKQTIDRQEQVILLLNRRGFAPVVICDSCGTVIECPHCSISLNFHQGKTRLMFSTMIWIGSNVYNLT